MANNHCVSITGAMALVVLGTSAVAAADLAKGKALYDLWCHDCHAPLTGMAMFPPAGSYRLQERYQGTKPAALTERTDLDPDLVRAVVRQGLTIMPPTRKTEVTDAELDAIIAYLWRPR
jgi:mono/diheme cytochrome c family protein